MVTGTNWCGENCASCLHQRVGTSFRIAWLGARRVWRIYPARRVAHIHAADAPTRVIRGAAPLTDKELLPGFALPLTLALRER